jgi:GT2 family glycosyltransferase
VTYRARSEVDGSERVVRLGAVVLTTGERPRELAAALDSIRAQRDVEVDTVVVCNADSPVGLGVGDAADVEVVRPGRNLGIPGGRNLGVERLGDRAEAVLFLDDDAELAAADVLRRVVAALEADPTLAVVTMRLRDPDTGHTERRHVPRLVVGDPARSSWVTTFLGGACVIRTDAYTAAGGLPEAFFYAHEETSLAWRLLDAGWRIRYRGDLEVLHPAVAPSRHADYHRLSARNRVLLAHLHLPFVVAAVYVAAWTLISVVRAPGAWRAIAGGLVDGVRMRHLDRQPIRWRTILRMTLLGRPPVL